MAVVENSLKFATMELIAGFFCILFALGISIDTAVLASQKGRNSVNWVFLSLYKGYCRIDCISMFQAFRA